MFLSHSSSAPFVTLFGENSNKKLSAIAAAVRLAKQDRRTVAKGREREKGREWRQEAQPDFVKEHACRTHSLRP